MQAEKPISESVEKIAKECEQAGASAWTITKIVKGLAEEETLNTEKLRKRVVEILKKLDPKTAAVFASFQRMNVRTSRLTIEPFDRGNIIKSLLKETNVNRGVAENIGRDVENKIKDQSISYLNTALIREMVNAKLLEYGHEGIRMQYARVGTPVFDVEKKIGKNTGQSREILVEFNLLKVIPKELSDLHLKSDIFIAALHDFSTKPLSCCIRISQKESMEETMLEAIRQAMLFSRLFSWTPNINGLNLSLSKNLKKRKTRENARFVISALNCLLLESKKTGYVNLPAFTPEGFEEMAVNRETSISLMNMLLDQRKELAGQLGFCVCVDSKYRLKLLNNKVLDGLKILNCNSQQSILLNGFAARKDLLALFGLNLERIAFETSGSERRFFEKLDDLLNSVIRLRETKTNELKKRGYLKKNSVAFEEFDSALAMFGLANAGKIFSSGSSKKEAADFCEKTVKKISSRLDNNWIITELADNTGIKRFRNANNSYYKEFAEKIVEHWQEPFQPRLFQKNYYYGAIAQNRKQLQELIERNVPLIEARFSDN